MLAKEKLTGIIILIKLQNKKYCLNKRKQNFLNNCLGQEVDMPTTSGSEINKLYLICTDSKISIEVIVLQNVRVIFTSFAARQH